MNIYRKDIYVNEAGVHIFEHVFVHGPLTEEDRVIPARFSAQGSLNFPANGQVHTVQFFFDVPGGTIEEAFAISPAASERAHAATKAELDMKLQQQAVEQQRKIMLAQTLPPL